MRTTNAFGCLSVCVLSASFAFNGSAYALEPYQMVRSLQRLQDEIAGGDRYAIGMQQELYKEIRLNFQEQISSQAQSERNLIAIMIFVLAGGGHDILQQFSNDFAQNKELRDIAIAIHASAQNKSHVPLADLDLKSFDVSLSVPIALVRGLRAEDPVSQIKDLDYVRVAMPGTLYEEAALRELMKIYRKSENAEGFMRTASRYARVFGMSPYASQFASEVNRAVAAFDGERIADSVLDILMFLDEPARTALHDQITRTATLKPDKILLNKLNEIPVLSTDQDKTSMNRKFSEADRLILAAYSQLSVLSSDEAALSLAEIQQINIDDLNAENRPVHKLVLQSLNALIESSTDLVVRKTPPIGAEISDDNGEGEASTSSNINDLEHERFVDNLKSKISDIDLFLDSVK